MDPSVRHAAEKAARSLEQVTRRAAKAVNYFQTRDIVRYWKVIERRVLASILDYLEEHEVDVREYRLRATQILNSNVVNMFNGDVVGSHFGEGNLSNTTTATAETQT